MWLKERFREAYAYGDLRSRIPVRQMHVADSSITHECIAHGLIGHIAHTWIKSSYWICLSRTLGE